MTIILNHKEAGELRLVCSRDHEWVSPLIGIDWDGPVFTERFCPTCGGPGHRPKIVPDDVADHLNAEQIAQAGQDAMWLFMAVFEVLHPLPLGEEKSGTFSLEQLCKRISHPYGKTLQSLERLSALRFLNAAEVPKYADKFKVQFEIDPGLRRFTVSFGDKVRMVKLTDGAY